MEMYHPMCLKFIKIIDMIANDEAGQGSADFDSICDNIMQIVCGINVHKANKLVISTYKPTQLYPIHGHPFL
eukprot:15021945-Ditylum_brightwellii.AAC.1